MECTHQSIWYVSQFFFLFSMFLMTAYTKPSNNTNKKHQWIFDVKFCKFFQDQCLLIIFVYICVCYVALHTHHLYPWLFENQPKNQLLLLLIYYVSQEKTNPFFLFLNFYFTVRKDLELRLQFRFFNNLHRKSAKIQ